MRSFKQFSAPLTEVNMLVIHRIFLDFFHRPVFQKNTTFRKLDLFPSSGEGGPVIEISSL
jgi:hypothetical protein